MFKKFWIFILMSLFLIPSVWAVDVAFQWGASTGTVNGYRIYTADTTGGPYREMLGECNGTTLTMTIPLSEDKEHFLICRAFNIYGESGNSNEVYYVYELLSPPTSLNITQP